jgi:hypothetical protein
MAIVYTTVNFRVLRRQENVDLKKKYKQTKEDVATWYWVMGARESDGCKCSLTVLQRERTHWCAQQFYPSGN